MSFITVFRSTPCFFLLKAVLSIPIGERAPTHMPAGHGGPQARSKYSRGEIPRDCFFPRSKKQAPGVLARARGGRNQPQGEEKTLHLGPPSGTLLLLFWQQRQLLYGLRATAYCCGLVVRALVLLSLHSGEQRLK